MALTELEYIGGGGNIDLNNLTVLAYCQKSNSSHTLTIPSDYIGKTIMAIVWYGQSSAMSPSRYANESFTNVTDLTVITNLTESNNIAPGSIYLMTPTSDSITESNSGGSNHNIILLGLNES